MERERVYFEKGDHARIDGKMQLHSPEVKPADYVNLLIDKKQMGLACENSWGAIALPQYRLPYGDYTFRFKMIPVSNNF